jgi:hypothetical protein
MHTMQKRTANVITYPHKTKSLSVDKFSKAALLGKSL